MTARSFYFERLSTMLFSACLQTDTNGFIQTHPLIKMSQNFAEIDSRTDCI